jgi:hypothetical protein
MKPFLLCLLALPCAAAHAQPLTPAAIPTRGASLQALVPRGWKIEKRVSGDLNRDRVLDAALVLVENKPIKGADGNPSARERALVVALKRGSAWRRVGVNTRLLPGTRGGGAFYGVVETPVDVQIQHDILAVNQEGGSREIWNYTHLFRFDARSNRMRLIGVDETTNDRLSGDYSSQSTNYLTGVRKTTQGKANESSSTRTTRVARKLQLMESVSVR